LKSKIREVNELVNSTMTAEEKNKILQAKCAELVRHWQFDRHSHSHIITLTNDYPVIHPQTRILILWFFFFFLFFFSFSFSSFLLFFLSLVASKELPGRA